ncbi:MAG: hypothetical protein K6C12_12725 [Oscillospiraceae bacterium]|nr:hypothetical protein [Oscillospiraceae bacterium]
MKCPRCGAEMSLDSHRKIPLNMCYECGYIEGRAIEKTDNLESNYTHLRNLNLSEASAFLSAGLKSKGYNVPESDIADWLMDPAD